MYTRPIFVWIFICYFQQYWNKYGEERHVIILWVDLYFAEGLQVSSLETEHFNWTSLVMVAGFPVKLPEDSFCYLYHSWDFLGRLITWFSNPGVAFSIAICSIKRSQEITLYTPMYVFHHGERIAELWLCIGVQWYETWAGNFIKDWKICQGLISW